MKELRDLFPGYMMELLGGLTWATFSKWLIGLLVGISAYVFPDIPRQLLVSVSLLMIFDTVTGVVAAKVGGEQITSTKFSRCLVKGFTYTMAMCAFAAIIHVIPKSEAFHGPAVGVLLTGIAGTEFVSVMENMKKLGWRYPAFIENFIKAGLERVAKTEPSSIP